MPCRRLQWHRPSLTIEIDDLTITFKGGRTVEQTFLAPSETAPFANIFQAVQHQHPLVDCITNIVTVNVMANGLLAIDARPVMASAPEEITYFVARADALLLNLGATGSEQREAMLRGAAEANRLGKPVVIDPVGVGTSPLRRDTLAQLLAECQIACIRGNISEIKALAGLSTDAGGVDASEADLEDPRAFTLAAGMAKNLAAAHHTVIAISGPRDIVSDGRTTYVVNGGNAMMTRVTGSGCTLTGLVAAFAAVAPADPLRAATAAIALMCRAGDRALAKAGYHATASFHTAMFDALSAITPQELGASLRLERL